MKPDSGFFRPEFPQSKHLVAPEQGSLPIESEIYHFAPETEHRALFPEAGADRFGVADRGLELLL